METIMSSRIDRGSLIGADLKMSTLLERDAGFCSGEDEEDLDTDLHSPTDTSEDSVDVKVKPVSSMGSCRNKRKCIEPRKVGEEVKRRIVDLRESTESNLSNPFRPWSHQPPSGYHPNICLADQQEPLSLVLKDKSNCHQSALSVLERLQPESVSSVQVPRHSPQEVVRLHDRSVKQFKQLSVVQQAHSDIDPRLVNIEDSNDKSRSFSVESLIGERQCSSSTPSTSSTGDKRKSNALQPQQRNYKNMTRERRIEANARERTRVHTISAAFDTLRRAVPAYSHNQKLSKLSVLRIACSYILTLSRVAGYDYSAEQNAPSLSECVKNVSKTIQMEGKLRKKKDE